MDKDYLLHKWLNGDANEQEIAQLKAIPEYLEYIKISTFASELQTPQINSVGNFEVIRSKIANTPSISENNKFIKFKPRATILNIAAVLIVLIIGYLFISIQDSSIKTDTAQKENFSLPDASEFSLNAKSSVTYSKKNWAKERSLKLEGEAYFKVTSGNKFTVETSLGDISVLGTEFNVFARGTRLNVHCYEGLVSVTFNDTIFKLPAGARIQVEEGQILLKDETNAIEPSWITNESSFYNATLSDVLEELKRQYPIQLTAKYSNANRRFTGSFTHQNLDLALKSICDPMQLAYTIEEESVTIYAKEPK